MLSDAERADNGPVRKPWLLHFRSSNGFILATVCVAIFTVGAHTRIKTVLFLKLIILLPRTLFSTVW